MSRIHPLVLGLAAWLIGPLALARDLPADLKSCRLMADAQRRLACYDALPLPATASTNTPLPAAPDPAAQFGQESVKNLPSAEPELKQIESRVRGVFKGWRPNTRIELENGQVWRVADDSEAIYELQSPRVVIRRGMLGAFFLDVEGVGFQMKVVRVR